MEQAEEEMIFLRGWDGLPFASVLVKRWRGQPMKRTVFSNRINCVPLADLHDAGVPV